ncbi:DUF6875 domain-containing protein [Streptomyces sp. NPDC099050]|uniref:DUF6875 domain-containing protein n=1 Tax=Streptomyces sp. NPDC099050 TaxID=3366100 RepID=UPI003812F5F8
MYEALKNAAVSSGLMIGQFHPLCAERAVRSRTSAAPGSNEEVWTDMTPKSVREAAAEPRPPYAAAL